jgi:enoyl-CoA hydratase
MAATAYRMNAADAIYAGFADTAIKAEDIPAFVAALCEGHDAGETARRFANTPGTSDLAARQADLDFVFGAETIQEAVRRLEAKGGSWAEETLRRISAHSPTALAAAHFSVRKARGLRSVEESIDHEYRYAHRAVGLHDFREGVRALIVDKDGKPQWRPARLDDVRLSDVVALFAPLGKDELGLVSRSMAL